MHTIWTFEGPRIKSLPYYRWQAWHDYGIAAAYLLTWCFDEEELMSIDADEERWPTMGPVAAPPPHHRF